jgi:receptor protein-tyrosine kinase
VRAVLRPTFERSLSVLPPGRQRENPSEVLGSPRVRDVLLTASTQFDVVLFDTPAAARFADAALVARNSDGVVLVARSGATRAHELADAAAVFDAANVPVLGVVLTHSRLARAERHSAS